MSENTIVDARGLSCPQPVMLTNDAIKKLGKGTIEVLVDSDTARENVSRLARNSGWKVNVEKKPEGEYHISITK
jgi:tRNA 2-thiouridine synthesizing protein A